MDADCLIKLTKSGQKDLVCKSYTVSIPEVVKKEVVDVGKAGNHPDAELVEENIQKQLIRISKSTEEIANGDQALITRFNSTEFDAVATDDAKLVRRLKTFNIL